MIGYHVGRDNPEIDAANADLVGSEWRLFCPKCGHKCDIGAAARARCDCGGDRVQVFGPDTRLPYVFVEQDPPPPDFDLSKCQVRVRYGVGVFEQGKIVEIARKLLS